MIYFLLSLILSFLFSFATYRVCLKYKVFDIAKDKRKIHKKPTPNLGGIAFFLSFWIVTTIFIIINHTSGAYLKYIIGLFIGSLILFITGLVDDRRGVSPKIKFVVQVLSALIIIAAGVGITYINKPLGGFIFLDQIKIPIELFGSVYNIALLADLFALLWIVGIINVINFLDGLDGLASGVSAIAFFVIYILSINPTVAQPLSAIIALIMLGAILGFIPLNLNPAKLFMGDNGSMVLGFFLAVLAIIAGSKVATALLVLGLPVFDGLWVVISRIIRGKKPWIAGRDHLHHKLLDLGLSRRWIVIIFWLITALFGSIALISGTYGKFIGIISLVLFLVIGMSTITILRKRKITQ